MAKMVKIFAMGFLHVVELLSIAFDLQNTSNSKMPNLFEKCAKMAYFSRDFTIGPSADFWEGPKI